WALHRLGTATRRGHRVPDTAQPPGRCGVMGVISDQARSPGDVMRRLAELERAVTQLRNARVLENAAIGAGGLRVHSGGSVRIQDGGNLNVSGDTSFSGDTEIGGRLVVDGDAEISGPNGLTWSDDQGRVRIRAGRGHSELGTGTELMGIWYLDGSGNNRLQLGEIENSSNPGTVYHGILVQAANGDDILDVRDGRIYIRSTENVWIESVADMTVKGGTSAWLTAEENVRITAGEIFSLRTRGGASNEWGVNVHSGSNADLFHVNADRSFSLRTPNDSHRIHVAGNEIGVDAPNPLYVAANGHATGNLSCGGTKPFIIDHPTKPDRSLVHVATESDKAVVEYHYRVTIGDDGSASIDLPDYFEALTAPDSRGVQVTPVGRPFMVGAEEPADGQVTVYGDPGRDVFVRINARRGDDAGQFEVDIPRIQPPADTEESDQS